jgi:hypothetical protein
MYSLGDRTKNATPVIMHFEDDPVHRGAADDAACCRASGPFGRR